MANVDQTAEEIAAHYVAMGHSVDVINGGQHADEEDEEWVLRKARNVDHLVLQKGQTHEDESSWWTGEDFTDIDAAIAA
jgi:hypothetical protein